MSILEKQPVNNIGLLGSVSHGKSTLVKLISGKATQQHSKEKIRNITMKVGYANAKIWEKDGELINSSGEETLDNASLKHHFSFVDCPGHHELIDTMMSGATVMDGGIVVVAGNLPPASQPQLYQHLLTAKLLGLTNLIFILNKLDLVNEEMAKERYYELKEFLEKKGFDDDYLIIPMALNLGLNKKYLLQAIMEKFPPTDKQNDLPLNFAITRSFDLNKPGITPEKLKGGAVGGSLLSGKLNIGDEIEIRPGQVKFDKNKNQWIAKPFTSKVVSLFSEKTSLDTIIPGGLMAVGLEIDPYFTKNDGLKGQILGKKDKMDDIYFEITLQTETLEDYKIQNKIYHLQIGANSIKGKVNSIKKNQVKFILSKPSVIDSDKKIFICDKIDNVTTIIALGSFNEGKTITLI